MEAANELQNSPQQANALLSFTSRRGGCKRSYLLQMHECSLLLEGGGKAGLAAYVGLNRVAPDDAGMIGGELEFAAADAERRTMAEAGAVVGGPVTAAAVGVVDATAAAAVVAVRVAAAAAAAGAAGAPSAAAAGDAPTEEPSPRFRPIPRYRPRDRQGFRQTLRIPGRRTPDHPSPAAETAVHLARHQRRLAS